MSEAPSIPCAMRRPKRVAAAYSSSRWTGLRSPVTSAKARTSSSVTVFETSAASPTLKVIRFLPASLRKELQHRRVELGGLLDLRDVAALVEDDELRLRYLALEPLALARERRQPV